jgi:hypothetical protein
MLDGEPLFTPLTIEKIAENAQKSKEWKLKGLESIIGQYCRNLSV